MSLERPDDTDHRKRLRAKRLTPVEPRERNWLLGIVLISLVRWFGDTGYCCRGTSSRSGSARFA